MKKLGQINVRARLEMQQYRDIWVDGIPDNISVISVIDPGVKPVWDQGTKGVLTLTFDDIDREHPDYRGRKLILFSEDQARQIVEFLDQIGKNTLFVHCTAGISRSGAIGTFAAEYLDRDPREFRARHPWIIPNVHVLNLLRRLIRERDERAKSGDNVSQGL